MTVCNFHTTDTKLEQTPLIVRVDNGNFKHYKAETKTEINPSCHTFPRSTRQKSYPSISPNTGQNTVKTLNN